MLLHPYAYAEDLRSNPPNVTIAAHVDDCDDLLYSAAIGQPIDNVRGGFRVRTTVMSYLNGMWKATTRVMDAATRCKPR